MIRILGLVLLLSILSACGAGKNTLGSLDTVNVVLETDKPVQDARGRAMDVYWQLMKSTRDEDIRQLAMMRLADLEMESGDDRLIQQLSAENNQGAAGKDYNDLKQATYKNAITLYSDLAAKIPDAAPQKHAILYKLARAYEQSGDVDQALVALDRIVANYPQSPQINEIQFRRGEILFEKGKFDWAEHAYTQIVLEGEKNPYYEKSLYKHGWALYRQDKYVLALNSFSKFLDRRLPMDKKADIEAYLKTQTDADQLMLDDVFRAVSMSFVNIEGVNSIGDYFNKWGNRNYEYVLYKKLAEFYESKQRFLDAADAYATFGRLAPTSRHTPVYMAARIEDLEKGGFVEMAIKAKEEFVTRFYPNEKLWKNYDKPTQATVLDLLDKHLVFLSGFEHAKAQKRKQKGVVAYQKAMRWYKSYLTILPGSERAPDMRFMLAEIYFEVGNFEAALREYEFTAYNYKKYARGAEAGYAALLAYAKLEERAAQGVEREKLHAEALESALKFGKLYPHDEHTPAVMSKAAEDLFTLKDYMRARSAARRVLEMQPKATKVQRRTAWTVLSHSEFESGEFERAQKSYEITLSLYDPGTDGYRLVQQRIAASVYKQAEKLLAEGQAQQAIDGYLHAAQLAPDQEIRLTAKYDAVAVMVGQKQWQPAVELLRDIRQEDAGFQREAVAEKLAFIYLNSEQYELAAAEIERLAAFKTDPEYRRQALLQAAELYEKANRKSRMFALYESYVDRYPRPLETSVEIRNKLALFYKDQKDQTNYYVWLKRIVQADAQGGIERTDRTRTLAAQAALVLTDPLLEDYHQIKLTNPLNKSLKRKKASMEKVLAAFNEVAEYGVAEVTTAATFHIGRIYLNFAKSLMESERPPKLSPEELEQYDVLLEEQAYPFEEKAIEIYQANVIRIRQGLYDEWVAKTLQELGKLRPVRFAKAEKSEAYVDALQ